MWQTALDAADHLADPAPRIHAHRLLGAAYADLDRHEEGILHLHQSLDLAEKLESPDLQAKAHREFARIWARQGDHRRALEHATRARDLFHRADQPFDGRRRECVE